MLHANCVFIHLCLFDGEVTSTWSSKYDRLQVEPTSQTPCVFRGLDTYYKEGKKADPVMVSPRETLNISMLSADESDDDPLEESR